MAAVAASPMVGQSTNAATPKCNVTTAINAGEPTFTPSSTAPATGDLRSRGISGPLMATNTNAGRKIPIVATMAPGATK